ncbi:hypothetical protein RvY_10377 [Ramazzottius varieornatus]|uniref:OBG-type G domain-containing protein n=1 Tax=Ramazzottius varieornatus TaxID=947166 RepID=A0A1D1VEM8_RAMVA|nr:hypothetical protein RvY_10377 [Ramazzottius varieornatus]
MGLSKSLIELSGRTLPRKHFIDSLRLHVRGGTGGNGLEKYGGVGGKGGDVYFVAEKKKNSQSLRALHKANPSQAYQGGVGKNSMKMAIKGVPGEDVLIEVPLGVVVMEETGQIIGEVNQKEDKVLAARGGEGGNPKNQFRGQKGENKFVRADLKVLADVGLVGFPNAGKSTLLSKLSRADPRIASFPFTTIKPELGILEYPDKRQISMADLPGLIEGAHMNVGLGYRFLRHVERTRLLLFVVDISGFRLSPNHPSRTAFETLVLLNKELELYKESLVDKPAMLAVNKMDSPDAEAKYEEFVQQIQNYEKTVAEMDESVRPQHLVTFDDVIPLSGLQEWNTDLLKTRVRDVIDYHAERIRQKELEGWKPRIKPLKERGAMLA